MSGALRSPSTTRPRTTPLVLATVVLAYGAMEAMLIPALPVIQQRLGASTQTIAWAMTGLLLVATISIPITARLCDVADKRRVFLAVLGVVIVGAVVSATAATDIQLIAGQLLQGVGGGLVPLAIGILNDTQPAERLKSSIGLVIGVSAGAATIGVVAAGVVVGLLPFGWIFGIPLIFLVGSLVVAWRAFPACPPAVTGSVDWGGGVLLGTGLVALMLAITVAPTSGWGSGPFLLLAALAVVLLVLFGVAQLRTANPLVDVRAFRNRSVGVTCAVSFTAGFSTFAVSFVVPNLASLPTDTGYGLGASATVVGGLLLPLGVIATVVAPLTPRLERVLGARAVMALSCGFLIASGLLLLLAHGSTWPILLGSALCGLGIGLGMTQAMNIVVGVASADRVASMSGTVMVLRSVGATFGTQIGASVLVSSTVPGTAIPTWGAYTATFLIGAAVSAVALVLTLGLPARLPAPGPTGVVAPGAA